MEKQKLKINQKNLSLIRQEKNYYCLCAVLSYIFSNDGNLKSQDYIASRLTRTKDGFRIDDENIKNFLNEQGYDYSFYWWNETPFNEPDSLLEEIMSNDGFVGIGKHVKLVVGFEYPWITFIDPETEKIKDMKYMQLMSSLQEKDGGFGLLKKLD
jgi:hypothetical protein